MLNDDKLVRCKCGKLYHIYAHYVGDQSICPSCRQALQAEYERQQKEDKKKLIPNERK